ncbi:type I restriction-modification system M protein [Streptococcus pneumoniae]|uniref:Type I restriction-modification system M protein n=1 Tax=Streptococcus pneumoniae TaxID=1313 RepID=A0A4J1TH21_STREE|nr:type I restriction-modification system M protein [Streptococcus pneumoniae]VKA84864.1 type I restriction-modification system M protein [Streptococcus pneumoniae]VKD10886.1 type I restriction-modification system M protein [Streptococcus pneumoniae]VMM38133.1 type I restriction-modification system M protein [Streptococcus pneumoniae]VMS34933.1 type I restriction-modification system M protein [Streptococcus pneumoniae]
MNDLGSSIDRKKNIINYKNLHYLSPEQAPSRARKLVSQNSVLFSTVRPYLKNIAVVRELKEYLIASTAFIVLDTLLNETYLKYYLLSDILSIVLIINLLEQVILQSMIIILIYY